MKISREELLRLGEEIVCRQGFGGFSYGALSDRAGIRKASIHHHFPAKIDFGRALIERRTAALREELSPQEEDRRRGCIQLRALIATRRARCVDGSACDLLTAMAADAGTLGQAAREALAAARELIVQQLAAILQTGRRDRTIMVAGDIEDEARAILAQVEGAELAAKASGEAAAFDRVLATLQRRMSAY